MINFRKAFMTMAAILFSISIMAQNAQDALVKYRGKKYPGVSVSYDAGSNDVEGAIVKHLEASGLSKKNKKKGFLIYRGVSWSEILPETSDVYIKVKGNNKKSSVEVMVSKGYDNFITPASDPAAVEKIKNVLNAMPLEISDFKKARELAEKEAAVEKAQADLKRTERIAAKAARRHERAVARRARKQAKLEDKQKQLSELK